MAAERLAEPGAAGFREQLLDRLAVAGGAVVREQDDDWHGDELVARSWGAADWLDAVGAAPGRPVAALLYGSGRAFALATGGALTGRPLAPLNPKMTAYELAEVVTALGPSLVVVEPALEALADAAGLRVACAALPTRFAEAGARGDVRRPDDVVAILHTSGTTGAPKAVRITDAAMHAKVAATAPAYEFEPGGLFCTVPPFHHMSGLIMGWSALASGSALAPVPWFSVDAFRRFGAKDPSHVLLVPTMLEMLRRAGALPAGVRVVCYGGSPVHPALLAAVMEEIPGVRFVQVYGQTEGSPITKLAHEDHLLGLKEEALLTSAGRPVPGLELRLADPDDEGVGEITIRAPHLYAATPTEWHSTGDLGRLDERGYLFLTGRRGDKIVRGGENVYPLEVERVLEMHPGVREAAVIGIADQRLGEAIQAILVPADAAALPHVDDLVAFTRARLSGFKVPARWRFVDALPRTASGKLVRRRLLEEEHAERDARTGEK